MKQCTILLILLIGTTLGLAGYKLFLSFTHPIKYQNLIIETSIKYNLEPSLVASLINTESSYNKNAKSSKNAIGLMQIKLTTANYIGSINNKEPVSENDLYQPAINIEFGCMYLHYLNAKFSNIQTALAAYNAGETCVRNWLKNSKYSNNGITLYSIPYKETDNYIIKIKNNLKFYSKIYSKNIK